LTRTASSLDRLESLPAARSLLPDEGQIETARACVSAAVLLLDGANPTVETVLREALDHLAGRGLLMTNLGGSSDTPSDRSAAAAGITLVPLERAWREAEKAWQADPFNAEKEKAAERAQWALKRAQRAQAEAEGIEYPSGWHGVEEENDDEA
jgi:hypothetical protein